MFDSWALQYCVACDKQVQVENDLYCSESCRLADFETTSSASSPQTSSPGAASTSLSSWNTPNRSSGTKFYLSPAYDFSNAQPYGTSAAQTSYFGNHAPSSSTTKNELPSASLAASTLSPSSSHSSLCSMQSTTSTSDSIQLSDKARKELRAYAVSFEHVRLQRRRSY